MFFIADNVTTAEVKRDVDAFCAGLEGAMQDVFATVRTVLTIEEEGGGGASYCWVSDRPDGYRFYGNEIGLIAGPCPSVAEALLQNGFEAGTMEYVAIESTLSPGDFANAVNTGAVVRDCRPRLFVNGADLSGRTCEEIIAAYQTKTANG